MKAHHQSGERRRADATRNIAVILDAAIDLLTDKPDASMTEIAAAAGVARQTVYAHYESREALLAAVLDRAAEQTAAAMDAAQFTKGPPVDALLVFLEAGWKTMSRHSALIANPATPMNPAEVHERLAPLRDRLEKLIRRGQRAGVFDRGLSPSWLVAVSIGLTHTASDEVRAGRLTEKQATKLLEESILRVFGAS